MFPLPSRKRVKRRAEITGCEFAVDGPLVTLYPPEGFAFEGEYRMLEREVDPGWVTKLDIYEELFDAMDDIRPMS